MRFHLIDRIDEYEPSLRVRGRKLVSGAESGLRGSAGGPVLNSPLVLEALCQAGTWLIMLSTERRKRAALLQIGSVEFSGVARPGDEVVLDGVVESMSDEMAVLSGTATVDGVPIMRATDIMCALIDAGDLAEDADSLRLLEGLVRS
ncbi:3-hydroxyacyl-ACP dehydratase FabZ family protein [Nocardia sp. NPDC059239]|uniref:3-hydroxyacyl-ACP dehydratase FabZ family protein n=1 Tax=unclassified Nocardia TaxID=2637762 RepID=UPI00367A20C6